MCVLLSASHFTGHLVIDFYLHDMICLENILDYFLFFRQKIPYFGGGVLTSNTANAYAGGFLYYIAGKE